MYTHLFNRLYSLIDHLNRPLAHLSSFQSANHVAKHNVYNHADTGPEL